MPQSNDIATAFGTVFEAAGQIHQAAQQAQAKIDLPEVERMSKEMNERHEKAIKQVEAKRNEP